MTMLDALRAIHANPDMWARPVAWRKCHQAIGWIEREGWVTLPWPDYQRPRATIPRPETLFGEWEVVTPDVVNAEGDGE